MIAKGIIFCHVLKMRQGIHFNPAITLGNQKCNGAAPSFNIKAAIKRGKVISVTGVRGEK